MRAPDFGQNYPKVGTLALMGFEVRSACAIYRRATARQFKIIRYSFPARYSYGGDIVKSLRYYFIILSLFLAACGTVATPNAVTVPARIKDLQYKGKLIVGTAV